VGNAVSYGLRIGEVVGYLTGEIAYFTGNPLIIEGNTDFYRIDVHDNSPKVTPTGKNPNMAYKPITSATIPSDVNISSSTYTKVRPGIYRITVSLNVKSTALDYPNSQARLIKSGVEVISAVQSLKYITNPTIANIRLECLVYCNFGEPIELQARSCNLTSGGTFTVEWIRDE
jgi:hypothetical protein